MRLFIGKSILRREFAGSIPEDVREVLARAVRPALLLPIKGADLPAKTNLLKAYATSRRGPQRIVLLLVIEQDHLFLLFYRPKGDKIGDNVSIKNPAFNALSSISPYFEMILRATRSWKSF